MGAPLGHARHHRQHRLGPVQRLDLALLVHAQHHRLLRRVVVEPDDIDDLLHEERVGGQLEGVLQVRLEVEFLPDPPDGRLRQPRAPGHRGPRPVRVLARGRFQGGHDHVLNLVQQDRRRPSRPRLIVQAVQAPGDEPGPPPLHRRLIHPQGRRRPAYSSRPPRSAVRSSPARARYWAVFARLAHRVSWARSASVKDQLSFLPADRRGILQPRQALTANWRRHLDTDLTATPSACAAPAFDIPRAHAKMIRARSARHRPGTPARRTSSARSSSDSTISRGRRTRMRHAQQPSRNNPQNFRHSATSAVTANVGRVDHAALGLGRPSVGGVRCGYGRVRGARRPGRRGGGRWRYAS